MTIRSVTTCVLAGCVAAAVGLAVRERPARAAGAVLAGGEVLSRPTDRSVLVRALAGRALSASVQWGQTPGQLTKTAGPVHAEAGDPVAVLVDGLRADTDYVYRFVAVPDEGGDPVVGDEHRFHTQRAAGSGFTFTVQADPHLDENSSTAVYSQALRNQLADGPDFMVDLGDAAMTDKCVLGTDALCVQAKVTAYEQVSARNALMRSYFSLVGHSLPLFMVLGNHEAEGGWNDTGGAGSLYSWALRARKFFYANPEPDAFYSGNADADALVGLRQDYYAFEWGDGLFVVLDPFTYTKKKPTSYTDADMWTWTLGAAQYHWLEQTLSSSRAKYKFVFSHHMVGGSGPEARGGTAFASTFEWGGRNLDGTSGWAKQRPGWAKPIHQLMVDHKVTIWFHGHDHVYVREALDGVVYQEVPQPSTARYNSPDLGAQYGYEGTLGVNDFPSAGHLRVRVDPVTGVQVSYVRAVAPGDETAALVNGAIVTSYVAR